MAFALLSSSLRASANCFSIQLRRDLLPVEVVEILLLESLLVGLLQLLLQLDDPGLIRYPEGIMTTTARLRGVLQHPIK